MEPRRYGTVIYAALIVGLLASCGGASEEATPTTTSDRATIELKNFAFMPREPRFQVGQAITLDLKSLDIEHTFTVPELNIDWSVEGGKPRKETFTFAKPGKFKLICAIAGHEGAGMIGTVTVVE